MSAEIPVATTDATPEAQRSALARALDVYQAAIMEHARFVLAATEAEEAMRASAQRVLACKQRAQEAMQVVVPDLELPPTAMTGQSNLRFRPRGVPLEGSVPDKLINVLRCNPHRSFRVKELAAAIGSTRAHISSTLCRLARDSQWPVESPERGHFRFKPVATDAENNR